MSEILESMLDGAFTAATDAALEVDRDLGLSSDGPIPLVTLDPSQDDRLAYPVTVAQTVRRGLAEQGLDFAPVHADARHSAVVGVLAALSGIDPQRLSDAIEAAALAAAIPQAHALGRQIAEQHAHAAERRAREERLRELASGAVMDPRKVAEIVETGRHELGRPFP